MSRGYSFDAGEVFDEFYGCVARGLKELPDGCILTHSDFEGQEAGRFQVIFCAGDQLADYVETVGAGEEGFWILVQAYYGG